MSYSGSEFQTDATRTARSLHLAYRRCTYLLSRWYSGINAQFPAETYPDLNNLMSRVAELKADYEDNSNAKLNTVMKLSDLQLPGDA